MTFDPSSATPAPEFDPTTAVLDSGPPVRAVLRDAVRTKPDDMAEAERLRKRYPAPVDTLYRNLADVKLQEAVDVADERLKTSPKLAQHMRDNPLAARLGHDDIEPLAELEAFTRDIGGAIKAGVFRASRGAAGTFQAGLEFVAPALDAFEPDDPLNPTRGMRTVAPLPGGNPLRRLAEGFAMVGADAGATAKAARPKSEGVLMGGFFSGIESLTSNLLALPMAFAPGGQGAAMAMMTAGTGGDAYQTAREKGLSVSQALPFAVSQGAIEYATEKLPLGALLKDVKAGTPFFETLARQIALEIPGEQIATVLQDLNEWAILNPEKPFSSYLEDRPSAAAQTLVATIVGAGGNVAVMKGLEAVIERGARDGANMQRAGATAQALEQAMKAAAGSALRERSPEQFRQVMTAMAEDGSVYLDAEVLGQLPADLLQQMEGVADELPAALAAGGSVAVKLADALTLLPGTTHADTFMQNARVSPDAPSALEAEAAGKKAGEFLKQEADRVIAEATNQDEMRASAEAVRTLLLEQINATGRHRPAVAEGMSQWASAFYTTMASRMGVTPEQFYAAHPLRILGAPTQQGQVLNEGARPGTLDIEGYHFSAAARPVLSTAFYGTGLKGSAREEIQNYPDKRVSQRLSFYFDKGTGIRPESGAGSIAHRARLTNVYDADTDLLGLRTGDARAFETAVLDAGFSGYANRMDGAQPGQVVMLGPQTITPEVLGSRSKIEGGERPPALQVREAPWQTQASGTPEQLQAKLEKLQANPAWSGYDLRIEGGELQARKKGGVYGVLNQTPAALPAWSTMKVKGARITAAIKKAAISLSPKASLARRNYDKLDAIFAKVPNPLASEEAWLKFQSLLVGDGTVLGVPYEALKYAQSPAAVTRYLSRLRPDQLASRRAGFELGAKIREQYAAGQAPALITGRLLLWAMLSRKAGAYPHEAAYMDLVNGGVDEWIQKAVDGNWTEEDSVGYVAWSSEFMASKKGGASPSAGVTSNANDYGRILLTKMSEKDVDGRTQLTRLHDMIADQSVTTDQVRREFFALGDSLGIQNKVLSFALLVTGRWDTLVLDRVQFTHLWGDTYRERAGQRNIYDLGLAAAGEGHFGLAVYEALARGMSDSLRRGYADAGLTGEGDGTLGAFHWDSWLIESSQAIGHPTIESLMTDRPRPDLAVRQGKFDTFSYNFEYRADGQYQIPLLDGSGYRIISPAEASAFQSRLRDDGEGVVPKDFGVSKNKSAPWVDAAGVDRARYDAILNEYGRRADAADVAPAGLADAGGPVQGDTTAAAGSGAGGTFAQDGGVDGRPQPTGDGAGRYSSGGLTPLAGAPAVAGATGPDARLVAVAEQYAADNGIDLRRQPAYVQVDPARAARIAQAYEEMAHAPQNPRVKEAYDNLIQQTLAQYLALQAAGYKFYLVDETNDPYTGNPWNAMRDLRANQTMGVFATEAGFGSGATELNVDDNPLLADTGLEWGYGSPDGPKKRVLANDLFRAVHDAFGHGLEGAGFRAQGEENAWQAHHAMFTGSAVGAITSETRGQNSWLNYGPHGEKNQTAKVEDTVFADQKTGLMPEWTWNEGVAGEQVLNQGDSGAFKRWFGESKVVDAGGNPLVVYHGSTRGGISRATGQNSFFTSSRDVARTYSEDDYEGAKGEAPVVQEAYLRISNPLVVDAAGEDWMRLQFEGNRYTTDELAREAKRRGHDGLVVRNVVDNVSDEDLPPADIYVTLGKAGQIKSAIGNDGTFDANDPSILSQQAQTPRGTFNPKTLELVLNPNANLSTFFHETGHFFLEVMADIASQPGAPAQIVEDMNTFLKWAGIPDLQTWNALDLDGKRASHERWAESIEQYVMEGKAPSAELAPLMRRFATWLKSVYGSIKRFLEMRGQAPAGGEALNQMPAPEGFQTKVVDKAGKPLPLYHGAVADIQKFDPALSGTKSKTGAPEGTFFFTDKPDVASSYTVAWQGDFSATQHPNANVMQVYVDLRKPLKVNAKGESWREIEYKGQFVDINELAAMAKASGKYDGVIVTNVKDKGVGATTSKTSTTVIAFDPKQIVSAISGEVLGQDPAAPTGPPMALNDDIRRVMDRMLATDEQIAQANEVAGLMPNEDADAEAAERLNKRSMADLKWAVKARDQAISKLRKQAAAIEKDIREAVTVEVDSTSEMRAKRALDALSVSPEYAGTLAEHKAARKAAEAATRDEVKAALLGENPDAKGIVIGQLLMKNKRDIDNKVDAAMIKWDQANPAPRRPVNATDADVATIADSFGFETVDAMMQAVDAYGPRAAAIDGITEQRMLEEHGDLIDERAIAEAANEAVHNEARARSLATELRTQGEMLGARADTGETNAKGSKITVNALVEAARQFGASVVARTPLRDLKAKAWQHTAAEKRAGKRWQEATAAGNTADAVKAKQDQVLNNAAAKAAIDARAEAKKIVEFFRRVTKGNDETVVEKGRDADIVNAARAVLAAYGVETSASKGAQDYLDLVAKNDPETFNVIQPMVAGAMQNAQPLDALTFEELQALHEEIQALWFLAKRTRQFEVGGDLMDVEDAASEIYERLEEIGIPDTVPGEAGALTPREERARQWLQQVPALLRRVEQWAEAKDGKFGGPFLRYVFQPVKDAADRYRTDRLAYRKKFQALVDTIAPRMTAGLIAAPELGYTFGRGHNGVGHAELLHAILHTGNASNKRKLLLGRGWATENADGTLDTARWDALTQRLASEGVLTPAHYDFAQGVWNLLEQTKPLAQKTHRDVFGRYFAEVTADSFVDPWGQTRAGGYVPAQADPALVQDADLRELLETENAGMAQAFPSTNKGFTKGRVEYNRPLKLDLRTLAQHIDKVLLFSHMEPAVRGAAKLLRQKNVSQPLARVDPGAMGGMLKPWLNRSARQTVETPISADAGLNRIASTVRGRVGMALMFANVSNTLQQITGFSTAALRVKPALMARAAAQFVRNPKRSREAVWALSPYMADRASNEVAVLSDTMEKILIDPSVYQKAEMWTRQHGYFLQTAMDNVMSPIIWSAAYNQSLAQGMAEGEAIRFADGTIRQTQGSTLPEDVSRFETGPAYARLFTQFVGYFNMLANTNATALKQIADEQGLKKGAGKAFGVLMLGLLAPIWVAETIAHAMRGGPDDEDDDGYLDDWLAAVFGFGTIRGLLAQVPILGQAAQSVVNRFNTQPADDKFSLSPTVSVLESAAGSPASVYKAIVDDGSKQKAVRDVSALITVVTGLPAMTAARPVGYLAGVADNKIDPTGPVDAVRGLITGTASPDSKQK